MRRVDETTTGAIFTPFIESTFFPSNYSTPWPLAQAPGYPVSCYLKRNSHINFTLENMPSDS
jgi:hypothetical protein